MQNINDKFGVIVSVAVTAIAIGAVGSFEFATDDSIQPQGISVIDRTVSELQNAPDVIDDISSDVVEKTENLVTDIPEIADDILEESQTPSEVLDKTSDVVVDVFPDLPKVVKQSEGKLLETVSIPIETGVPGCEISDTCYIPYKAIMKKGGEVIWTNHDTLPHTVTSGNPNDGPDGLFDSDLIMPGDTYSIKLDLAFEYDYFCLVHPWMQGSISVK
ncbi:MAG: hypothetical protein HKM23_01275 [Nitrosopumilus sp.]|nr:hypothetical protein [Nitrosopumilus sp.]